MRRRLENPQTPPPPPPRQNPGLPEDAGDTECPIFAIGPVASAVDCKGPRTSQWFLTSCNRGALGKISWTLMEWGVGVRGRGGDVYTFLLNKVRDAIVIGLHRKSFMPVVG